MISILKKGLEMKKEKGGATSSGNALNNSIAAREMAVIIRCERGPSGMADKGSLSCT